MVRPGRQDGVLGAEPIPGSIAGERLPVSGESRQSQKGQRKRRTSPGVSLTAVPELEHRIQERRNAVRRAAVLSGAGRGSSPDAPGSMSLDGESSVVSWPSVQRPHDPPDITPQMSDTII
ncbi:hypothetical protein NDU88_006175 [Pleurodeles waltl]|uniref:Uncharacterized protein n=1 Tax=Pleurodeles waltl TaxID=8319 RepID=A0AAV7W9U9_PLEWA|nr:hypothetical protein NDU88_006175 [Pleurodeles waltl]